ncbi:MAG: hypothetical protein ACK4E0_05715 [Chitinophagaceae bacterium]|jgi:hypothetical protein
MSSAHYDYNEELQKVQDKDFTHSWVSSSGFVFYLSLACLIAFSFGGCFKLYTKRYEKPRVTIQESSLYTPKYK